MSENSPKKIKVFKKKPQNAPVSPAVETPEEDIVLPAETKSYDDQVAEDDEFERLLNQFISSELEDVDTGLEEKTEEPPAPAPAAAPAAAPKNAGPVLDEGEKALFEAYKNFSNAIVMMAGMNDAEAPDFRVDASLLSPHYKYRTGSQIADDAVKGWEIMFKVHGPVLAGLNPEASDEELLDFAEHCEDEILQLAVISYVEILIEMEGCEIALEERRLKAKRRKIEREIYEEHQRRIERKQRYIEAIRKKKFPVDAERLVNNYFKTAQKDPDSAYQVLINNPAVYAPIDTSKLQPRFFGLIKPTPQDGIRVNRELGCYLKKIKA